MPGVIGAIRDKWLALGGPRSFLGQPLTDELAAPDGVGRFNRFEGGVIYFTPATGAQEVHGAILEKWASLGLERSFLGYPTSDETDFPPDGSGGRVNTFQHGAIYFWPDTGAIALNEVAVHYTGLNCFGETDNDQGSNSDEPYVVIGVAVPEGDRTVRTPILEDVDAGESRPDVIEVFRGPPRGLTLRVAMMEHDDDDPDRYTDAMRGAAAAAAGAIADLLKRIPKIGPVVGTAAGPLLAAVAPKFADAFRDLLDLGDDNLGNDTIALSAKDMVVLASRPDLFRERDVGFKLVTKLFDGEGSSYKVYFNLLPA
jgi:hypothetical protein